MNLLNLWRLAGQANRKMRYVDGENQLRHGSQKHSQKAVQVLLSQISNTKKEL